MVFSAALKEGGSLIPWRLSQVDFHGVECRHSAREYRNVTSVIAHFPSVSTPGIALFSLPYPRPGLSSTYKHTIIYPN